VTCWYLWWMRRRHTQNEDAPPLHRCKLSILAITTNAAKDSKRVIGLGYAKWTRPEPRHIKLTVDASLNSESCEESVGVVLPRAHL
jgi:hypothetical protein